MAVVRNSGEPLLLEIKQCWSYLKCISPLVSHLWVRIWGCATSLKYEEQLWCANEDVFAVVDSYQAFVLLLPSLVRLMLLLRLFYCSSGMHMGWEREKQQSLSVNICYQLNQSPFNNGGKKNNSPSLLQLHSFNILIPKAVLSYHPSPCLLPGQCFPWRADRCEHQWVGLREVAEPLAGVGWINILIIVLCYPSYISVSGKRSSSKNSCLPSGCYNKPDSRASCRRRSTRVMWYCEFMYINALVCVPESAHTSAALPPCVYTSISRFLATNSP